MGTGPHGGVLVCVGDDPQAKSSSVPSTSEPTLFALAMPILTPADPQEILELGLHGFALSRASGLWVGLRIPATVADSTQSVELSARRVRPIPPDVEFNGIPFVHQVSAQLLGAKLIELESSLYGARLEIARRYGDRQRHSTASRPSPTTTRSASSRPGRRTWRYFTPFSESAFHSPTWRDAGVRLTQDLDAVPARRSISCESSPKASTRSWWSRTSGHSWKLSSRAHSTAWRTRRASSASTTRPAGR